MEILTQEQLSEALGVSIPTIISWQKQGLPHLKAPGEGRTIRFVLAEVVEWMRQNAIAFTASGGTNDER